MGQRALAKLKEGGWIDAGALVVFEVGADEAPEMAGYEVLDERSYGAAKVLFLRAL